MAWFANDGDESFYGPLVISTVEDAPLTIAAADMDGDADLDAVVGDYTGFEATLGVDSFLDARRGETRK